MKNLFILAVLLINALDVFGGNIYRVKVSKAFIKKQPSINSEIVATLTLNDFFFTDKANVNSYAVHYKGYVSMTNITQIGNSQKCRTKSNIEFRDAPSRKLIANAPANAVVSCPGLDKFNKQYMVTDKGYALASQLEKIKSSESAELMARKILKYEESLDVPSICKLRQDKYKLKIIGYGRHCDANINNKQFICANLTNQCTETAARSWLQSDIKNVISLINKNNNNGVLEAFKKLDDPRKAVIIALVYQIGYTRFVPDFKNVIQSIINGNMANLPNQIKNTTFGKNYPARANRYGVVLRNGQCQPYCNVQL